MKKAFYNFKLANSKLLWCIITLFALLSFAMKVDCNDGISKSIITLPKAENGIEKIEYMVNGEAKGSTDGINSIELEPGAKITFAVKFQSEGYSKLHVRNVKIKSENGSVLRLNTYAKDNNGNFILMRVQDSELINPNQTYISSDYIVGKDDKFSFEGIEEDKYCVKIADENNDVNLSDAVKLKYSDNGGNYIDAQFSENENVYLINNLTKSSNVKLMFEIKEGYTDSDLSLVNGENRIAIDSKSKICTLPILKDDTNLEIRNLEKNSYIVTFNEYTNAKFSHRIAGSEDDFTSSETVKVNYGESLEIKCETSSDDILESCEVTANGKTIVAKDGIYTLENIKDSCSMAITPKANAVYTVSLPKNEDKLKLCDTFGNAVSEIGVKKDETVNFKLVPEDAYKRNFILAEMYAVPLSKLSNGNYDITANPEEAKSFLIIPSGDYVYTLKNVTEPVAIIAVGMEKAVYTVTLPDKIIGAKAEIETNENVTRLTENKFEVVHGSDLVVNLEAEPGYDLSTISAGDVNNSIEIAKDGNKYTFKNIDSDKYLIINGASTALYKVSFEGKDIIGTNESGFAWKDNTASIKYQEGTLKFKVRTVDGTNDSDEDISLNIKSGGGKLEKIPSEKNTYSLSKVTGDIVLSAERTQNSDVTITLKSDDDDIQFTDADDESIILPEDNTVKYGSDLNFKVLSKSGKSTDNISVLSDVSNPTTESDTSSNTYSVTALRSGVTLTGTGETKREANYIDLCAKFHINGSTYDHAYSGTELFTGDKENLLIILSKDPEACDCINGDHLLNNLNMTFGTNNIKIDRSSRNYRVREGKENQYAVRVTIPQLEIKDDYNLWKDFDTSSDGRPFELLFKYSNYAYRTFSEGFKGGWEMDIPYDDGNGSPKSIREKYANSYYALKDGHELPLKPNSGYQALQYLKDCYCNVFTTLYPRVELTNNLKRDANIHNSSVSFTNLNENIERKTTDSDSEFIVKAYSESASDLQYSFDLSHPAEVEFTICLDEDKQFSEDVNEPFCLNAEAHAKIIEQKISEDGGKVECKLQVTPYDENVQLNWSANSIIKTRQCDVRFASEGGSGIFKNSQGVPTDSDTADYQQRFTFFTEPSDGRMFTDSLNLKISSYNYNIDNIANIYLGYDNNNEKTPYNSEWIKLYSSDSEPQLFIRAIMEDSRIRYEIAGKDDVISEYIVRTDPQPDPEKGISYTKETLSPGIRPKGLMNDFKITSSRNLVELTATFSYAEGIEYKKGDGSATLPVEPMQLLYGDSLVFAVSAKEGYDISDIQVLASTSTASQILELKNGVYAITQVTDSTTITVSGVKQAKVSLSFEQHEGVTYKSASGEEYLLKQQVPYNEEIAFQIDVEKAYSTSTSNIKVYLNYPDDPSHTAPLEFTTTPSSDSEPYIKGNLYIIPQQCVNNDIKITIEGLETNKYIVSLTPSQGVKYIESSGEGELSTENKDITYGNSFKFRLSPIEGYDISNIEVVAKASSGGNSPITLIPANGVYTIENITSDYTVTISGVAKQQHTVEFRTVTGVAFIDSYGKTMPSSVTVYDGDDVSFYLSFDSAYSKSKDTANVTIKGSNNTVPRDSSGKYTLSNITADKIIEIINVTKNTYTATFIPAEGVIYRTAKGKEFAGTLDVEYGESLYFKLSLLDAYDQSIPSVKANGKINLLENGGSYVLDNISDDVTITVENVQKNPEELTIENIQNVPNPVTNENDVNAVVAATKAYNSLSDDEKKLVTNRQALEKAQGEAGYINHNSNDVSISGVDWNVKLIVTTLNDDDEEVRAFGAKLDRRSLLSLYRVELVDLLTNESYNIPDEHQVQIIIPCPDLTGYKNVTVAHENLAGNMDYLDPNIVAGTVKFYAPSVGLFGVAAKKIPNYSENTSDMSISMGDLVSDDEELKTLLGEDLSSQLGHLIDLEDEDKSENGGTSFSDKNSGDNSDATEGSGSLLNNMAAGMASLANSAYSWALDNEFLAVMAVLVLGSLLILLILLANRRKGKEKDHIERRK